VGEIAGGEIGENAKPPAKLASTTHAHGARPRNDHARLPPA
jgi:hypothetical protein